MLYLKYVILIASAVAQMEENDDTDPLVIPNLACAKSCNSSPDDPCGNGRGQTNFCVTLPTSDDAAAATTTFIGCPASDCETACVGMDDSLPLNVVDGVYCFPKGNGMYDQQNHANMFAIAMGCRGSHQMPTGLFYLGSGHGSCTATYQAKGVTFGEEDSKETVTSDSEEKVSSPEEASQEEASKEELSEQLSEASAEDNISSSSPEKSMMVAIVAMLSMVVV